MAAIHFSSTAHPNYNYLQSLLAPEPEHPHIHLVDMPFRLTSTWQDYGCEIGLWESAGELLAWAVFQPPWWNLDYALHSSVWGSELEKEIFLWGQEQMRKYAAVSGEAFYGSVEFLADAPFASKTRASLEELGFQKFEWSILHFTATLTEEPALVRLPSGFNIRPLKGLAEAERYVYLHRTAFGSNKMTVPWRTRTLMHPAYKPELDLVVVNTADEAVGFCICWINGTDGQIEPLGVLPDYQGQGLGRALEQAAVQTLWQHGVRTMHVDHGSFNEAAMALSQQTGFKQSNNALRYYIEVKPN